MGATGSVGDVDMVLVALRGSQERCCVGIDEGIVFYWLGRSYAFSDAIGFRQ